MIGHITIGIIGCGMAATYHINNFLQISNITLKWICDQSERVLKETQGKYPLSQYTTDYKKVLRDTAVDAVVICTPPNSHFKIAIDAIKAKKHILIEKPATITRQELSLLCHAIKNSPNLTILDCSARHSRLQPKFKFLKEKIQSGEIGHVYAIHHNAVNRASRPGIEYHPQARWFLNKTISGGGPLIDWGVYDLSFHLGVLEDKPNITSLKSFTANGLDHLTNIVETFDIEEHAIVTMEFDNGLTYYWERATNAHNEAHNETRIYGTKGGFKLSYLIWESSEAEFYYCDKKGNYKKEIINIDLQGHNNHERDFYEMDKHFIDCILKKDAPILPFNLSAKHLEIIFDCMEKAQSVINYA